MRERIHVKKLVEEAIVPRYVHEGDSGMDIYSIEEVVIPAGEVVGIHTGLSVSCRNGLEIQVRPKSGLAMKNMITVLNTPGTIDSGYRGEIIVLLMNHGTGPFVVKKEMKIAQLVVCPVVNAEIEEVETLTATTRGEDGFGSSGTMYTTETSTPVSEIRATEKEIAFVNAFQQLEGTQVERIVKDLLNEFIRQHAMVKTEDQQLSFAFMSEYDV